MICARTVRSPEVLRLLALATTLASVLGACGGSSPNLGGTGGDGSGGAGGGFNVGGQGGGGKGGTGGKKDAGPDASDDAVDEDAMGDDAINDDAVDAVEDDMIGDDAADAGIDVADNTPDMAPDLAVDVDQPDVAQPDVAVVPDMDLPIDMGFDVAIPDVMVPDMSPPDTNPPPVTTPGLRADYYNNTTFTGFAATRTDTQVNLDKGTNVKPDPDGKVDATSYSIRWTGTLTPPVDDNYRFYAFANDFVRVWLDGVLIINDTTGHGTGMDASRPVDKIALIGGHAYEIRVDYYQNNGTAQVHLDWSRDGATNRTVIPASAFSLPKADLATGLIGFWKLDDAFGKVATDSAGLAGNGRTLAGGNETMSAWTTGTHGGAMQFIATSRNAIEVIERGALSPRNAITVGAWVRATNNWNGNDGVGRRILQKGAGTDEQYRLVAQQGELRFVLVGIGTVATDAPTLNAWHHVAGTYDGEVMRIYVDGVEEGSNNVEDNLTILTGGSPLHIGAPLGTSEATNNYFNGALDDVVIFGRALDAADIDALGKGTASPVPPAPGLVGYWALDGNGSDGSFSPDGAGPNKSDASLVNNPSFVPGAPGRGSAVSLLGGGQQLNVNSVSTAINGISAGMTISAWVFRTSTQAGVNYVLARQYSNTAEIAYSLALNADKPEFKGRGLPTVTAPAAVALNRWVHVAATFDGTTTRLYVDAAKVNEAAGASATISGGGAFTMGAFRGQGGAVSGAFFGRLDDVRLYKRALGVDELADLAR